MIKRRVLCHSCLEFTALSSTVYPWTDDDGRENEDIYGHCIECGKHILMETHYGNVERRYTLHTL